MRLRVTFNLLPVFNNLLLFYSDDIDDLISVTSVDSRRRAPVTDFTENPEDDRESVQSGLATLPDSSYAGFERVQPPSSTPNRPAVRHYMNYHMCMSFCKKQIWKLYILYGKQNPLNV